ncbi:hypothetical protein GSI_09963 [Ganoderma sinense ZZ0214-1]|uniref:F-box domain-containing protein n=1 Tax=Ganoderma sinense ZZ0214-1 TaxID=1077348 RepID=A0A2G8S303_9APHY|nr:hypothetical protein GSI_09963 [Ganoderma sinense ZZ0214-1]
MTTHEIHRPIEDDEQVMEILDLTVNLNSLELSLDSSYLAVQRVSSAFSTLEVLQHLSLSEPLLPADRSWVPHALRALRAPLISLRITTSRYLSHSTPSALAIHFDRNVSHFATSSTLTSLHLTRIPMYDGTFLGLPRFPSVRSLTVDQRLPREPKMDALLHLFPSLDRWLHLRVEHWKALDIASNPQELAAIQAANTRAQEAFRWTKLDKLDCESSTALMLALRCPVRHLTIDCFDIPAIVRVQPRHVVIDSIRLPLHCDISHPLAATPEPVSTTHVVLIMVCNAQEYRNAKSNLYQTDNIRWDTVVRHATYPLSAFSHATHARLVLHCSTGCTSDVNEEVEDLIRNSHDAATSAGRPPHPGILAACSALRFFILTVDVRDETKSDPTLQRWVGTRAWRVTNEREGQGLTERPGGGDAPSKFEELNEYEATMIMEDEDMSLPEGWEERPPSCFWG